MNLEAPLAGLTLLLYFLASVAYHVHLFAGSDKARHVALGAVAVGVLVHTGAIGEWCLNHHGILQDPAMPFSLVAYFLALGQLAASFRRSWASLGSLTMPLAFVAQFFAGVRTPGSAVNEPPGGPMLRPHVLVLLLGFAAFTIAFCLAVAYLVQSRLLKKKQIGGLLVRLPPLEGIDNAAHWTAVIGFSMLTMGVITGALAAPERWGPHWYLDPRFLTSVLAWAIYAGYMAVSLFLGWRGRRTSYFLIAGFVVVLVAFMASVNHAGHGSS